MQHEGSSLSRERSFVEVHGFSNWRHLGSVVMARGFSCFEGWDGTGVPCIARWIHKHWTPREVCWPKILVRLVVRPTLKTAAVLTSEEGRRKRFCDLSVEVTHVDVCSSPRSADICSFNEHMSEQKGKKNPQLSWPGDGLGGNEWEAEIQKPGER